MSSQSETRQHEVDFFCATLPLVPFGRIWKEKLLAADMKLLEIIKDILLDRTNFNASEAIRTITGLSRGTKTPLFYTQLLFKSLALQEELELSSFIVDQIEDLTMTLHGVPVLHLIVMQSNPVVALADKVLTQCPAAGEAVNSAGETALHVVLQADSPCVELVRVLLQHCPHAATVLSSRGKLPIHMLFAHNTQHLCLSSLKLLLRVKLLVPLIACLHMPAHC